MGKRAILPNPENATLAELETAIRATPRQQDCFRLQAMRMLLMGFERERTAAFFSVTARTLANWISGFNRAGIDGLIERARSGRPRKIPLSKKESLCETIRHPEQVEQYHWTGKKFHGYLTEALQIEVGYRTVIRWLHEQGFRLKVPQPWPNRQDETQREAFISKLKTLLVEDEIELWYQDEMGVEGDPRPRKRWVMKGEKARVTKNGDHLRMSVTGMIAPRTGEFFALEFDRSDSATFQVFLDEANRSISFSRRRNLLIMDNASWHKVKSLRWGNFEPLFLPAYSPDLNPIEKLWLVIKAEWFADFIAKNRPDLIARLDNALCWAMARQTENQRTCKIRI